MDDGGRAEGGGGGGVVPAGFEAGGIGKAPSGGGRPRGDSAATTRRRGVSGCSVSGGRAKGRRRGQEEIDHPRIAPGRGDGVVRRFLFYFLSPRSPSPETRSSPQTEWRGHSNHPLHLLFCHFFHFLFLPLFHFRERSRFLTNLIFSRPPLPPPPLLS
jgi:hypothetical protein